MAKRLPPGVGALLVVALPPNVNKFGVLLAGCAGAANAPRPLAGAEAAAEAEAVTGVVLPPKLKLGLTTPVLAAGELNKFVLSLF